METLEISRKTRNLINDFLEGLQCKVPLESRIKLIITEKGKGFCGNLSIKSMNLNFNIECIEGQISEVIELMLAQSGLEIQSWWQKRLLIS